MTLGREQPLALGGWSRGGFLRDSAATVPSRGPARKAVLLAPPGRLPVSQRGRVDLDEAGAVDEDFGPHVAHGDQLGPVLQPRVVLLQDLQEETGQAATQRPGRTEGAVWGLRRRVWRRQMSSRAPSPVGLPPRLCPRFSTDMQAILNLQPFT